MINPREHYFLLDYLEALGEESKSINFVETGIDTRSIAVGSYSSNKLYVVPFFSYEHIDPQNLEGNWPELIDLHSLTLGKDRLFILGDPGMGKTSLVRRIASVISSNSDNSFGANGKPIIPFSLTLRWLSLECVHNWNDLIKKYFNQDYLRHLNVDWELLDTIFQGGQALVLLDGLDEIHSKTLRSKLSKIISEGIKEYPQSKWWFTSRIVGFDQEEFWKIGTKERSELGLERSWKELKKPLENGLMFPEVYLAPFTTNQIKQFLNLWFGLHEFNEVNRNLAVRNFMDSLTSHEQIHHLARIPNFLTMMAIFFRMNQRFPDGRIELFRTISKAYLEDINRKRGIKLEHQLDFRDQRMGLAALALRMQELRSSDIRKKSLQLTINEKEAKQIFIKKLKSANRSLNSSSIETRVKEFFQVLHTRSEILIPKTNLSFGFLHLSYQEFFAAEGLGDELKSFTGLRAVKGEEKFWNRVRKYAENSIWYESLVLFFEAFQDDWGRFGNAEDCIYAFERIFEWDKETGKINPKRSVAAARILCNDYIGSSFTIEERISTLDYLYIQNYGFPGPRDLLETWGTSKGYYIVYSGNEITSDKVNKVRWVKSEGNISNIRYLRKAINLVYLDLNYSKAFSELTPLKEAKSLIQLNLNNTAVSNLLPIKDSVKLKRLSLNFSRVKDLSPIQDINFLEVLDLYKTYVKDIAPLKGKRQLVRLDLTYTPVEDLSPISELNNLTYLYIGNSNINNIDPVRNLFALKRITISSTQVEDISPIKNLTNLEVLDSNTTKLRDLTPIENLKNLTYLYLNKNKIQNIEPISNLNKLEVLELKKTLVEDLSPLKSLMRLEALELNQTNVSNLSPIEGLPRLKILFLKNTPVSNLSSLQRLSSLEYLDLSQTFVNDLNPLKNLRRLFYLYLNQTPVSDLNPLSNLIRLRRLYLKETQVKDISPLSNLTKLVRLYLNNTQVKDLLPLKEMIELKRLYIPNTKVKTLSGLKEMVNLEVLHLGGNNISNIYDLVNLKKVKYLYLNDTLVDDLSPLKDLKSMEYLYLNRTRISDLSPLENLGNLRYLNLSNTKIKDLSYITSLNHLETLYINQTEVSKSEIVELEKKLPLLKVYF